MEYLILIVIPIIGWMAKFKYNDMKHLYRRLDRIEAKLDRHIEGHNA